MNSPKKPLAYVTEGNIFSVRLRECMKDKHITQEMLANAVGMRRQTISLYTTGQSRPDVDALSKMVEYLNVSADYLLGFTDDPDRRSAAMDDLKLTQRSINNILGAIERDTGAPPLMKAVNALLGSHRFEDIMNDLATYFFGKSVTIRQEDGKQYRSILHDSISFMEFVRPACLARIQENISLIKNDIDRRPGTDLSTKILPPDYSINDINFTE